MQFLTRIWLEIEFYLDGQWLYSRSSRSNTWTALLKHWFLVYLILAGISFILAAAMKGEKLVGWKVVLSLSVLSVVSILFATIMKIQLNFLTAEIANLGEFII